MYWSSFQASGQPNIVTNATVSNFSREVHAAMCSCLVCLTTSLSQYQLITGRGESKVGASALNPSRQVQRGSGNYSRGSGKYSRGSGKYSMGSENIRGGLGNI
jgi:hypothetical protein